MKKLIFSLVLLAGSAQKLFATTFAQDTFSTNVGSSLTAHTDNLGNSWTFANQYIANDVVIDTGNKAKLFTNGSATNSMYYNSGTPPSADYSVQYDVLPSTTVHNGDYAQIWARFSASGGLNGYLCDYTTDGTNITMTMDKVAGNSFSSLTSSATVMNFSQNVDNTVLIKAVGSDISCYFKGVFISSVSDSSFSSAGQAGISMQTNGYNADQDYRYQNFYAYTGVFSTTSLTIAPTTYVVNSTTGIALTGTGTNWVGVAVPFTVSGGVGMSLSSIVVINSTQATANLFTGTSTGTLVVTDTTTNNTANFSVTSGPPVSSTMVIGSTDTNIFWSPYNWYSNGGGAMQANNIHTGSTYALSNCDGSYVKLNVSGTTSFSVNVDTTQFGAISTSDYPILEYTVNGAAYVTTQITNSSSHPISLTGLTGNTQILIAILATYRDDLWTVPTNAVKITGFTVDTGCVTAALTGGFAIRPKNLIVYGDSITGGYFVNSSANDSGNEPTEAFPRYVGEAFNAEFGAIGNPGQGWTRHGNGNVPSFYDVRYSTEQAYQYYYGTNSRLTGGRLVPTPDYMVINMGVNDADVVAVQASVTAFLSVARSISGATCDVFPFGTTTTFWATYIQAGYNAYIAANPTDLATFFIQLTTAIYGWFSGNPLSVTTDGTHPNQRGHGIIGARMAQQMQSSFTSSSSSTTVNGNVFYNSTLINTTIK